MDRANARLQSLKYATIGGGANRDTHAQEMQGSNQCLGLPGVRTVRYFGSMYCVKMIIIPESACVNSSIFCATDTSTASVRYFGESHLATLPMLRTDPST